ncbi:MAG TPA: CoA transferase, partial [Caulobacteraceae bacterium]|nr:CoA transferase [Caulobacteraceae bacterium]
RLRVLNRDALAARLEAILATEDTETWVQRLKARGVPSGPINTIAEALADPQVEARGLLAEVEGRRFVRAPIGLSATPVAVRSGPPPLGRDSRAVLEAAGLAADEIEQLLAEGVIGEAAQRAGERA